MPDDAIPSSGAEPSGGEASFGSSDSDIRAAAASVFADAPSGENPSDPPPDTPSDTSPSPDAATSVDGAAEASTEASTLARGPIPYDRHQAVLTNTRNKVRAEVEGEYKPKLEQLSWAEKVDRQRAEQALGLMQSLEALSDDPQAALAFLARKLGVTTQQLGTQEPPKDEDPMPEPSFKLESGEGFYDAAGMKSLLDWQKRQLTKEVDKSFGLTELKQRTVIAELRQNANRQTHDILTECRSNEAEWPMFRQLEDEMKALMTKDATLSLDQAYRRAFNGPNGWRKQQADTKTAAEQDRASQLTRKLAASDPLRPGAPRAVTPRGPDDMDVREIAQSVFAGQLT